MTIDYSKIQSIFLSCLLLSLLLIVEFSYSYSVQFHRNDIPQTFDEGRILWGAVGDFVEASPYFPITINVPDIINGMGSMISGAYDYFFGGSEEEPQNISHPRITYIFREMNILLNDLANPHVINYILY